MDQDTYIEQRTQLMDRYEKIQRAVERAKKRLADVEEDLAAIDRVATMFGIWVDEQGPRAPSRGDLTAAVREVVEGLAPESIFTSSKIRAWVVERDPALQSADASSFSAALSRLSDTGAIRIQEPPAGRRAAVYVKPTTEPPPPEGGLPP